jgi:hypothetical protein
MYGKTSELNLEEKSVVQHCCVKGGLIVMYSMVN